jgi:hypothetical protein
MGNFLSQTKTTNQSTTVETSRVNESPTGATTSVSSTEVNINIDKNETDDDATLKLIQLLKLFILNNTNKEDNENNDQEHTNVTCDSCNKSNFKSYRYKCLTCDDYDLCGWCFEQKKFNSNNHKSSHPMVRFDQPNELYGIEFESKNNEIKLNNFLTKFKDEVHSTTTCDSCLTCPIKGLRFKCDVCSDYDMCYDCYIKKKESKIHKFNDHTMIVYGKTNLNKIEPDEIWRWWIWNSL